MMGLIQNHPAVCAIAGYFVFSALAGGMPAPDGSASLWYRWAYNSLHILAGNLTNVVAARYPEMHLPAGSAVEQHTETVVTTPRP